MAYFDFLTRNARWLLVGFLLTLSSSYGQTFFIALFAGQIREEFGLSHGAWGSFYAIGTIAAAITMIWIGGVTDVVRVRVLGPLTLALLGMSALVMSFVSTVWALVLVIFLLRFFGQGMAVHVAMVATSRWFSASRGRALTIVSMGLVLANAVYPMFFVELMSRFHWRDLWVFAGLLSCLAAIPIFLFLRQERDPRSDTEFQTSLGLDGSHWRRKDVLRLPLFWLSLPFLIGPGAWGTSILFQQVHYAEVKGWSLEQFVLLFPIFTLSSVLANLLSGYLVDRFGAHRLTALILVPYAITFLILGQATNLTWAAVGMLVYGISTGAGSTIPAALQAELFGTKHIGSIKSMTTALMVLGSALGPWITGYFIDRGIDFPDQMLAIAVFFIIAQFMMSIGLSRVRSRLSVAT